MGVATKGRIRPFAAVAIAMVALILIGSVVAFAVVHNQGLPRYFFHNRRNLAARLLSEVRSYDLINNYPLTADEVIAINNRIRLLFYGQMVNNDDLLWELVGTQRHLFSDYLVANNDHETQFVHLRRYMSELFDENVYLHTTNVGVAFRSDVRDMYIFPVTDVMINHDNLYWNYLVYLDRSGQWKIYTWHRTDASFRQILD